MHPCLELRFDKLSAGYGAPEILSNSHELVIIFPS